MRLRFLEDIKKAGSSCKRFEGTRLYVDTGSVDRTSISSSTEVSFAEKPSRANLCVREGDVLFAKMQGTVKVLCIDSELAQNVYSTGFYAFSDRRVLPGYMRHFFLSSHFNKEKDRLSNGATMKAINDDGMRQVSIPCPPLDRQTEIVAELDSLDSSIALARSQIALLDEQVKSLFNEMFGDPLDGKAKYTIGKAGDFGVAVDPQPSHRTPPEDPNGIPYVSIKDCQNGKVDFSKARLVGKHVLEEHKARYKLHEGDFIVGKIGTIGHPTFVPIEQNYTLSANIILIQPNPRLINPVYLYQAFKSEFVEHQYANEGGGTSQPAFGIQKFRNIDIIVPPLSVQNAFAERVNQIDKLRFKYQRQIDLLNELMEKKMEEYFGGEEDA